MNEDSSFLRAYGFITGEHMIGLIGMLEWHAESQNRTVMLCPRLDPDVESAAF